MFRLSSWGNRYRLVATPYASREKDLIMPQLAQATTATFLHPDPTGPVHEYDSIQSVHNPSGTTTVSIEIPNDAHSVSEQRGQRSFPITTGWEAIISTSAGEILVDGHVSRIYQGRSTTVYTIHH